MKMQVVVCLALYFLMSAEVVAQIKPIVYDATLGGKLKKELDAKIRKNDADIERLNANRLAFIRARTGAELLKAGVDAEIGKYEGLLEVATVPAFRDSLSKMLKREQEKRQLAIASIDAKNDSIQIYEEQLAYLAQERVALTELDDGFQIELQDVAKVKEAVNAVNGMAQAVNKILSPETITEEEREESVTKLLQAAALLVKVSNHFRNSDFHRVQATGVLSEINKLDVEIIYVTKRLDELKDVKNDVKRLDQAKDLRKAQKLKKIAKAKLYFKYAKSLSKASVWGLLLSLSGIEDAILDYAAEKIVKWYDE